MPEHLVGLKECRGPGQGPMLVTKIDMATEKAMVLSLKAELQKAKDAAQAAKEATEVAEKAAYMCGVLETEKRMAEEVAVVCRDYYTKSWIEALNYAGVPTDLELRKAERVFFPEHIQEVPANLPPTALPFPPPG